MPSWTQIRWAKSIPGRLFAYIGTDRVRRVPPGGKTRRKPHQRLRIGRYEDNDARCPAAATTCVRAAPRRIRTRAMKTGQNRRRIRPSKRKQSNSLTRQSSVYRCLQAVTSRWGRNPLQRQQPCRHEPRDQLLDRAVARNRKPLPVVLTLWRECELH